jgi:hypothetical protein
MSPPKNPASEALDPEVVERICKVFLIMSSPVDGDKLAAMRALDTALKKNDVDYHVLVARMKKPWLSDADKELFQTKLREAKEAGRLEGRRHAEIERSDDFNSTDGSDDWRVVARYVDRERQRLPARNRDERTFDFINSMAALAMSSYPTALSPARERWLLDLFGKLGGKIT